MRQSVPRTASGNSAAVSTVNTRALAHVVSINTNLRQEFRKIPRPEGRLVDDFGLEGDRHAGRPQRQVSILNVETVDDLARQGMPVSPGVLGENITVAGLAVMDLDQRTRVRLGEAELEITGDRPACREMLNIHTDALRAMVGRAGKMARVVRGGVIRPGDPIELVGDAGGDGHDTRARSAVTG